MKRTVDGYASNWICDNLTAGDTLRRAAAERDLHPQGPRRRPAALRRRLRHHPGDLDRAHRAGEGHRQGRAVLRQPRRELGDLRRASSRELAAEHADRFTVVHWLESVQGLPTQEQLQSFASYFPSYTAFCCGPAPFMKAVATALKELEFPRERRHQEKFVSLGGNPFGDVEEVLAAPGDARRGRRRRRRRRARTATRRPSPDRSRSRSSSTASTTPSTTGRATRCCWSSWSRRASTRRSPAARATAARAPASSSRATCAMKHNDVLDAEDLADGIRLVCQCLPPARSCRSPTTAERRRPRRLRLRDAIPTGRPSYPRA